jgi:diaminopimelate decarboxylase/alkylation response protein AidB-like acyl-CoA dehydrogenase
MSSPQHLLDRYGSPLFRYDLAEVRAAADDLRQALPDYAELFYSLKANPHPDIVEALRSSGCRAEVSSAGELAAALQAGHDPATVLYSGPGKSAAEIRSAILRGVRFFSTESLHDLSRVAAQARDAGGGVRCLLRVNASTPGASTGIRMTGKPSQFGFDLAEADRWAPRAVDLAGDLLTGLHFFPMSNARSAEDLLAEVEASLAAAAGLRDEYALPVDVLDLGGGFAAPYAVPGARPDYRDLRDRIHTAIVKSFPPDGPDATRIIFESGRYLTSTCGTLLATVTDVKQNKGRTFVVLDAGINHLGGMSGLNRLMPLAARPAVGDGPTVRATLVGPLCAPNDVLARDVELGTTRAGDAVSIPNVGAYGLSASLVAFLSRDLPVEVVVDRDGAVSATRQQLARTAVRDRSAASPIEICRGLMDRIAALAGPADDAAAFPAESLLLLRESGLMGLLVPRRYGGLGAGLRDLVEVAQALGGACASTAMIFAMHCQQTDAIVRYASRELRSALLPRIAAGSVYLASVTTEREKGGHLLTSAAPLVPQGDGFLVDREAPVVTGGAYADGFLVTMRAAPDAPPSDVTLVYAHRDELDIETCGAWNPLGMRGTESSAVRLTGTVPAHQLVGRPGEFRQVAVDCFMPVGHIGWSAAWLGVARQALARLVEHLRSGARRSSADVSSDLFAERLARARLDVEVVAAYLTRVVDEVEDRRAQGLSVDESHIQIHLNTLKILAAERTFSAVDRCLQVAGLGLGYLKDSPLALERAFRDLRSAALNYSNDRLLRANGVLQLTDRTVRLVGEHPR